MRMSQHGRIAQSGDIEAGPSEPESHIEHQAALDATLFQGSNDCEELVFVLDAGELRVLRPSTVPGGSSIRTTSISG